MADHVAPSGTSWKRAVRVGLPRVFAVLVIIGVGYLIKTKWSGLHTAIDEMGVRTVLVSVIFALVATACVERIWASVLHGLGAEMDRTDAAAMFFVSQLGKYLPGSVWPIVAQMEFGRRAKIDRRVMATANLLMLAVATATGLLAGAALLPWTSADGLHRYWWALLALIPLLVGLHPTLLTLLLNRVFRLLHQPPLPVAIRARTIAVAACWGALVWLLFGAHLLVMTRSLGAHGFGSVAAAIGGMGLAFSAGLLFIPAPAGGGIRDAVLVATFTPEIGATKALAVALASRVLLILSDVVLAGIGAVVRSRRAAPGRDSVLAGNQ